MYFCKVCNKLDEEGISGHHTRCKPVVVNAVANKIDVVVNKVNRRSDRHEKTSARKEYQRDWMRRKRNAALA